MSDQETITVLREQLQSAATALDIYREAMERSGLDISPCMVCGEPLMCLPDGMPMCNSCGREAREAERG